MDGFIKHSLQLLCKTIVHGKGCSRFEEIVGHNNVKWILTKAIISKKPVNVLLLGKPACAKTMFLTEIMRSCKGALFVVGSNTTKAGLVNQLFEKRPEFILIDELEKMSTVDQTALLHLMETGIISETKIKKTRQIELTSWVFATANSHTKIIEPLLSRFFVLQVPEYTFEQFKEIAMLRLRREKVDNYLASVIANKVWYQLASRDFRDVVKIARLTSNENEVTNIVEIMRKHKFTNKVW